MDYSFGSAGLGRLNEYFGRIGEILGHRSRRASFATYAMGLMSEGERKSMEPIASRTCADPEKTDAYHQRLGHFVTSSRWSDADVRRFAAKYVIEALTARERIETWIVDDTGFLKQGKHSVGVQRQYTGSAGKITNCQVAVSLTVTTRTEHAPIDFELYLPRSWTDDAARRDEAKIPEEVTFKTKPELALEMFDRALAAGIPSGVVLSDEAYGNSTEFRRGLTERGLLYAAAVNSSTLVHAESADPSTRQSARNFALALGPKAFRKVTWREGTGGKLSARFCLRRVFVARDDGSSGEPQWLLIEWRDGEPEPAHFYLSTLPRQTSRKETVRIVKQRYRTERVYEDMKGELGLDHFEGRRYRGWHHHVTVALACFAFIVAERARAFSPSTRSNRSSHPNASTPGTPLCGLVHHREARHRSGTRAVATAVSTLPLSPEAIASVQTVMTQ